MLCKYREYKDEYLAIISFFYGENSPLLQMEPNDEAYGVLEKMLAQNNNAQTAAKLVVGYSGFMPGAGKAVSYVAQIGWALFNEHVPINTKHCSPVSFGMMTPCIEFNNRPRFMSNLGAARATVSLKYRFALEDALRAGDGVPCTNEE